ncbi:hypothetical protein NL676_030196 [Syzygium grande]|nr:hypothetical protein NL676_030196 [Syzygium grande]
MNTALQSWWWTIWVAGGGAADGGLVEGVGEGDGGGPASKGAEDMVLSMRISDNAWLSCVMESMESMQLPSRFVFVFLFFASLSWVIPDMAMAEATTDPLEVQALNRIFQQWNLAAPPNEWNISGAPCSGFALSNTDIDDTDNLPYIKCDCAYDSGSTCHITKL